MKTIAKNRFDALAGYSRGPAIVALVQEYDWLATDDERVLGVLTWDRQDHDFGWVAMARDQRLRYRCVNVQASLPTTEAARTELEATLTRLSQAPDSDFFQGDEKGKAVDFFAAKAPEEKLHPTFRILAEMDRYSPAKQLISAMMRYHDDIDGNFIEQFQMSTPR